ncbi:hypothetical protein BDP55DRAFT_656388, partial [Colletotrichum godetiae]
MSLATKQPFLLLFPVVTFVWGRCTAKVANTDTVSSLPRRCKKSPPVRCPSPLLFSFLPVWGLACARPDGGHTVRLPVSHSQSFNSLPWLPAETIVAGVHTFRVHAVLQSVCVC